MGAVEPCVLEGARVGTCICPGLHTVLRASVPQGSVLLVTTPAQAFQLGNGGFCPCASHVDVSLGIHMSHAMHIPVLRDMHVPCSAEPLLSPAQGFGDGVTHLAPVSSFGYSSIPCRRVSSEQWEQMQLGVLMCVPRPYLPCEDPLGLGPKVAGRLLPTAQGTWITPSHHKGGRMQNLLQPLSPPCRAVPPCVEGHAWVRIVLAFQSRW